LKKKFRILIRTAGGRAIGKQLGLGHIYRTINLTSYLNNCDFYFLVEDYGGVKKLINKKKYKKIQFLKPNINFKQDIAKTKDFVKNNSISAVIIDRYQINPAYVKKVTEFTKSIVIADLKNISYHSNLIVNGFVGFKNQSKINSFGCKCLLGPKYQILNKKFHEKKVRIGKNYSLLITLGGFDEKNRNELLLKSLDKYLDKILVKIILGPSTKTLKILKNFEKKYPSTLTISTKTDEMQNEISNTRFGICGGGITSYEFAAMKVPFAIISQVKHQLLTAKEWEKRKYALNLGLFNKTLLKKVEKLLCQLIEDKNPITVPTGLSIIDGFGGTRVAKEIMNLLNKRI